MISRAPIIVLFLASLPLVGSCNDNEFAGSGSGAKNSDDDGGQDDSCSGDPEADAAAGLTCTSSTSKQCVEGDKVNIQWTGPAKECLDQGKTYNFDQGACAEMRQAQFDCNWANVTAELEKRNILTDVLRADSQNGSKLVSCGQSSDGNRIVVQWIKAGDAQDIDCTDGESSHHITTGCYTLYKSAADKPPPPANEAERAKQVYDCMNQL